MGRCARAVCALDGADEAGVGVNAVLWIIQALSSAIKRNDPPPPTHRCVALFLSYCDMRAAGCARFAWRSDVTSCDGLTSRFTSRPPAIRHIHVNCSKFMSDTAYLMITSLSSLFVELDWRDLAQDWTIGMFLWTQQWSSRFCKILGIYWLAEGLLRSQEVRCSVELGLISLLIYSLNK